MKLLKVKFISATMAEAIAKFCEVRCKDAETCVESCPEEQKLIEAFQPPSSEQTPREAQD